MEIMQELRSFIEEIGGGLPAAVIVASCAMNYLQWRRNNQLSDTRVTDRDAHALQLIEQIDKRSEDTRSVADIISRLTIALEARK